MVDDVTSALADRGASQTGELDRRAYSMRYLPLGDGRAAGVLTLALEAEEHAHVHGLLDDLDVIVWLADAATLSLTFVSRRVESLLGYRVESLGDWARLLHPDERELTLARCRAVAADGVKRQWVHRLIAADGRVLWCSTTVRVHEARGARELLGVTSDITERFRTEEILRATDAQQRLLLAQVPAILWATDRDLRFTYSAGAALERLGLRPGQLIGISLYQYFQTDDPEHPYIAPHPRAIATGEPQRFAAHWGGRWFEVHVEPLRERDGSISGTIGVALDVTERREAEIARDGLLATERDGRIQAEAGVRARDEFLAVASHELRTPVASLRLAVEAIADTAEEASPARLARLSLRQVERRERLVRDLLDVSRIDAGRLDLELEPVDLAGLARASVVRMRPLAEEARCSFRLDAPARVVARCDRSRVEQALGHLLANAVKFAPGTVIDVRVSRQRDRAALVVEDRGIGIPTERVGDVFRRFERAVSVRQYGGLGLGVYLADRIVAAHGGTIRVDSAPGVGTTFTVLLPVAGPGGAGEPNE